MICGSGYNSLKRKNFIFARVLRSRTVCVISAVEIHIEVETEITYHAVSYRTIGFIFAVVELFTGYRTIIRKYKIAVRRGTVFANLRIAAESSRTGHFEFVGTGRLESKRLKVKEVFFVAYA